MKKALFVFFTTIAVMSGGQRVYDKAYHPEVVYIGGYRCTMQTVFVDDTTVVDIDD